MSALATDGEEVRRSFERFGSTVQVLIGVPRSPTAPPAQEAAFGVEGLLRGVHEALTRFEADSELSRMNSAPGEVVEVSGLVASFVEAGVGAASESGGLVDLTVIDAVERSGYESSRVGREPASLEQALLAAPARRPALPRKPPAWPRISVEAGRRVRRPRGLRVDSGGIAKGLAADLCAARLAGYSSFAVDCGGDLRIGGRDGLERTVEITDPFTGAPAGAFGLTMGAVATSGLRRRVWATTDGFAHHLIDPGRGVPAWTGLVQASAVAPTAIEAETRSKAALLSGPEGAAKWLSRWGGIAFDDSGFPVVYGPLRAELRQLAESP